MGIVSAIRDQIEKMGPDKEQLNEQLTFLVDIAKTQGSLQKSEIELDLADQKDVIGSRHSFRSSMRVDVHKGADDGINQAVDTFFGGADGAAKKGIHHLVSTAVSTILGNATLGQVEEKGFMIALEHNAIVRVNYALWRYNFSSKSIIANCENAFVFTFCKNIYDHTKVSVDELVYDVSEQMGDAGDVVKGYIKELRGIYDMVAGSNVPAHAVQHAFYSADLDSSVSKGVLSQPQAEAVREAVDADLKQGNARDKLSRSSHHIEPDFEMI
ncbi:hypothetical protein [Crossiella sp. NPDC003009]